jgi:hypothetical protein
VALEKIDGVVSAYVNHDIRLNLSSKKAFDQKKVEEVLATFKMKINKTTVTKTPPLPKTTPKNTPKN